LLGPNANVDPNTGSRGAEAVISGGSGTTIIPQVAGIVINGFTISSTASGFPIYTGGSDITGLTVSDDIVGSGVRAITVATNGGSISILHNQISGAGYGINFGNGTYSNVKINNNVVNGPVTYYSIFINGGGAINGFELKDNAVYYTANIAANISSGTVSGNVFDVPSGSVLGLQINLHNSVLSGNTFQGHGYAACLQLFGSQNGLVPSNTVTVSNNVLNNCGANQQYYTYGIQLSPDINHIIITNNVITNAYDGINTRDITSWDLTGKDIQITSNTITGSTHYAVNNTVTGTLNTANNYFGTAVLSSIQARINGSVTFQPYYVDSGLTILNNVAPSTVFVGGTYVDGAAGGHIFGYDAFTTIQAGVNAVADGGTVNVAAGTYHESQIVLFGSNKGLTLQGAGASVTTIDGGNAVVSGSGTHPGTIYIKNPDTSVKIDGFTFINPVNNTSIGEITPIDIAFGSNPPTPPSITISNNHFIGVANNGANPFDNAIWVYATPAGTVTNITNNEFDHQWQSILLEQPQGGAVITGNNFHDLFANVDSGTTYVPEGIFLMSYGGENVSVPVAINNNTFSSFNGQSIALSGGYPGSGMAQYTNVQIENNQITADGFGIYFRNTGTTPALAAQGGIQGATISGNIITSITPGTGTGIWLRGPNNNATITNNSITGYANGILSEEYNPGAGTSTGVSVHETSLAGNTIAVSNQGSPTIDATNNWWGSTDPNFASIIQGSAAYTAWCSDATCTSLLSDSAVSLSASNGVATTSSTGPMTLTGSTSSGDATATIPAGTTITDSTGLWDGTLNPPVVSSYSVPGLSGYTTTTLLAISIGSNSYTLTFDRGVKLLLPGQAGQRVGFIEPGGSFTEITTTCSGDNQTVGDALPAGGACKINDGSGNLIIWTKHFTIFATYSQTANSTSAVTTISTPAAAKTTTYVIQPGDTMSGIASKFGLTLAQLENLNPQAGHPAGNFDLILPGDVLKVGGATASVASATTTVTTAPAATPTQPQQVLGSSTSTTAPLQTKPASKKTPAVASVSSNKLLGLKWWWWLIILAAVLAASISGSYIYKIAETDKHK